MGILLQRPDSIFSISNKEKKKLFQYKMLIFNFMRTLKCSIRGIQEW